jgi:hypothetical protein
MKITEKEFNVITGEETMIERDETPVEKQFRLDHEAEIAAAQAQAEAKATARQSVLDKLGLTAEEIAALLP